MSMKMQEEPDEDSQCLSDDTDIEISTQVRVRWFSLRVSDSASVVDDVPPPPSQGCLAVHRVPQVQLPSAPLLHPLLGPSEELVQGRAPTRPFPLRSRHPSVQLSQRPRRRRRQRRRHRRPGLHQDRVRPRHPAFSFHGRPAAARSAHGQGQGSVVVQLPQRRGGLRRG